MLKIAEFIGIIMIAVIFVIMLIFFLRFYSLRLKMFDSRITGLLVISDENSDAEIILRDLIAYIRTNEINCFRKIYIIMDTNDEQVFIVCRKICEEYPVFEIIAKPGRL